MPTDLLPDSRDKQDQRHNPGDKAFSDLVDRNFSSDEKQRLSDLANGEKSVTAGEQDSSSDSAKKLSRREPMGNAIPYRPSGSPVGAGRFSRLRTVFKGRRGLFLGGGALGLLIGAPFAILLLLPLKLPALLDIVSTGPMRGIEYAMEHRAERYLMSYILTKGGTISNSNVIVTGSPIKDYFANMKTAKFEETLKNKYDITLEGRGNSVEIKRGTNSLGTASTFDDLDELIKKDRVLYRDIKKIVKNEIPAWKWMKRIHMAKWLKLRYDVPRYGIRKSNETDPDKKVAEMRKQQLDEAMQHSSKTLGDGIGCVTGGECEMDNTNPASEEQLNTTEETVDDVKNSLGDEAEGLIEEEADKTGLTRRPSSIMKELTEKLTSTVVGKIGAKAIPIVGWVDLAATLSHVAVELQENDTFYRIMSLMREQSYANMWGAWAVYANQIQAGDMDQDYAGVLASQLDGAEESRAFNYESGLDGGKEVESGMKINSQISNNNVVALRETLEENLHIPFSDPTLAKLNPNYWILEGWYNTLGDGGLGGALWDGIGSIFSSLFEGLTPDAVQQWISEQSAGIIDSAFQTLNLGVDPSAVGPDLLNNLHGGSTVASNTYMGTELGGGELTDEQMSGIVAAIDKEDAAYYSSQSQFALIFSRDYKNSFINKLLGPSGSSGKAILKNIASLPLTSLSKMFSPEASASSGFENLYNIQMRGYTSEELSQPLAQEITAGDGTCAELEDKTASNICLLDKAVLDSMNAALTDGKSAQNANPGSLPTTPNTNGGISSYEALKNDLAQRFGNGKIPDGVLCPVGPLWPGEKLHCEAQAKFLEMNEAYKAVFGTDMRISDSYRSYSEQVIMKQRKGKYAATPGTSNHGWGLALDLGGGINNFGTPQYNWMKANAARFGWYHPAWAEPGRSTPEPWHWEYGTK